MAKLYFRHGAMNCGKSAALMQVAHNYNENDMGVIVIKSSTDTKADDHLQSRTGLTRKVDYLLNPKESIEPHFEKWAESAKCILVDEAQFLSPEQVNELWIFSKIYDRPVICYGLRTDFQSNLFEGSKRLLEVADEIEELTTICRCGNKAHFNARFVNGSFAIEGDSILIDGSQKNVEYKPMCGKCYIKNRYGR